MQTNELSVYVIALEQPFENWYGTLKSYDFNKGMCVVTNGEDKDVEVLFTQAQHGETSEPLKEFLLKNVKVFTEAQVLDLLVSMAQCIKPESFTGSIGLDTIDFADLPYSKAQTLGIAKEFEEHLNNCPDYQPDGISVIKNVKDYVKKADGLLCADSYKDLEEMITKIANYEDQTQLIDYVDGVEVWQIVEYSFSCKSFLEYIGYTKV